MKNYRPVLLQNLNLRIPDLEIHNVRINQMIPDSINHRHSHEYDQIIVFLEGKANQIIEKESYSAVQGSLFFLGNGIEHYTERIAGKAFLAVYIDLSIERGMGILQTHSQLEAISLSKIKSYVQILFRQTHLHGKQVVLKTAGSILNIVDIVLKPIGWLEPYNRFASARHYSTPKIVQRNLEKHLSDNLSLAELSQKMGWSLEQLNRKLKLECGLTLGQIRTRYLLHRAQSLLNKNHSVSEVSKEVGFEDNNYFSRWFKKHSGYTPTSWKRADKEAVSVI